MMSDSTANVPSVLLVDDTGANLIAMSAVLSPLGVRLVQAQSGQEALERLREESFAVVLLDVQMPDMDGFEVARRMRRLENARELPILFVTAIHRDEAFVRKGYAVGGADYITKPFDVDVLRARVKAFVDLYQQREEVRRVQVALRTRERDEAVRRVVAFERIATAALETDDLEALLGELLGIFLDGADAAEFSAIMLRAGSELRVSAALSRGSDGPAEPAFCQIGEGFVGRVAESKRPLDLSDSGNLPGNHGQWLRKLNARALFGVPLLDDGELLGVVYIGSARAATLTEREKRLLSVVSERAAWAVTKHLERSRLRSVLSAAPALIGIFRGSEHVAEFLNPSCCNFLGGGECVGKRASELGLDPSILSVLGQVYQTGEPHSSNEVQIRGSKVSASEQTFVNLTAQPLYGPSGAIDSVLMFAVDVSSQVRARREVEAHQAERALLLERERAARNEAEIANRAKDDFLATLSHELRTPLNAVLGWTARARAKAPPELERALSIVARNAEAQARIVDDMLDLSRIISGKLRLELVPVRIQEPVMGAVEAVRPAAEAKDVRLEVAIDDNPQVQADPDRLQQIVWNLLSNAIKFTASGGRVSVHARTVDSRVVISVSDTGQGIAAEFLPHVFMPFHQADASSTRRHGGLGLGLAIVRQLTQAQGGHVRATSPGVGLGSVFELELPIRGVWPSQERSGLHPEPERMANPLRLDLVKVLVVDDEPDARLLVSEVLGETGAVVQTAESVADALATFRGFRPDVLISDIAMPEADGYSLIRTIRSLPSHEGGDTKAIALTAYARAEDVERAISAGFQRHMPKPVDLRKLTAMVAVLAAETEGGSA